MLQISTARGPFQWSNRLTTRLWHIQAGYDCWQEPHDTQVTSVGSQMALPPLPDSTHRSASVNYFSHLPAPPSHTVYLQKQAQNCTDVVSIEWFFPVIIKRQGNACTLVSTFGHLAVGRVLKPLPERLFMGAFRCLFVPRRRDTTLPMPTKVFLKLSLNATMLFCILQVHPPTHLPLPCHFLLTQNLQSISGSDIARWKFHAGCIYILLHPRKN